MRGSSVVGEWIVEYQYIAASNDPSAYGRSVIDPTTVSMSGWSRRAIATMPGDRSTPVTRQPRSAR